MATRGFLIRFIDIGLIVLFGFLMISDLDTVTRVDLASDSDVSEAAEIPADRAFTVVIVAPDGSFTLSDPETDTLLYTALVGTAALTRALTAVVERDKAREVETVALIQPHAASPVQSTVDAMDVCERLSLRRSLQMEFAAGQGDESP